MSKFIYLYGIGETQTTDGPVELVQDCYLKCEIPDNVIKNGFFPSVIHAYIMYAKDIGLTVTDVLYSKNFKTGLADQLVYSLWPLFYVNNSEQFTANSGQHGMPVWEITTQNKTTINTKLAYSVHLNTTHGYFYRDPSHVGLANSFNNKSTTQSCPTPAPGNSVTMDVASAWNLNLPSPEQGGGDATSYAIIQHYNEWVVWNTLLNMQKLLDTPVLNKQYHGLRQATGQVLSAVVERPYAYDALVPKWSSSWPDKPDYYEDMRTSMNNYNIGASLFESSPSADPQVSTLHLLATALNIKGQVKAGHAETRLLLTLDMLDKAIRGEESDWYEQVSDFYQFDSSAINIEAIFSQYDKRNLSLISSLKPCYLCTGEVDATEQGWFKQINGDPVDMWACFPELVYVPRIKQVLYFDIDQPIAYPSYLETITRVDNRPPFVSAVYLAPWNQWTGFMYSSPEYQKSFLNPIGPRTVEPAGECLKTGEAYTRYKNSAHLLLTNEQDYLQQMQNLVSGQAIDQLGV